MTYEEAWKKTKIDLQNIRNKSRKTLLEKIFISKVREFTKVEESMFKMGYSQGVSDQMEHDIKILKQLSTHKD